jgi:lipoprotein-releasing system ATP-binding protein
MNVKKLLEAKNLCKSFQTPEKISLFQDLNLSISPQKTVAIMGASGEGKTTLLHILSGIASYDSGEIFFQEKKSLKPLPDQIGIIFQSSNLLEDFSVMENILMPARILRKNPDSLIIRARHLLDKMAISDKENNPVKHLSGGEKQRVAIARALLCSPKLIVADEPSGNLDHHNSSLIHGLFLSVVKEEKASLIVATHDSSLAAMCDEIYLLQNQKLSVHNLTSHQENPSLIFS